MQRFRLIRTLLVGNGADTTRGHGVPEKKEPTKIGPVTESTASLNLPSSVDFPPLAAPKKPAWVQSQPTKSSHTLLPVTPIIPVLPVHSSQLEQIGSMSTSSPQESSEGLRAKSISKKIIPDQASEGEAKQRPGKPYPEDPKAIEPTATTHTEGVSAVEASSATLGANEKGARQKVPSETSTDKPQRPRKLDIEAAKDASRKDLGLSTQLNDQPKSVTPSNQPRYVSSISQPGTPATAVSYSSASPGPRQALPRTIRVVQTPRLEMPPSLPSSGVSVAAPSTVVSRQVSRQPSIASLDQPGTPFNDLVSDNASLTSASMSRPSSPPLGKVGTAPIRQSTKSHQKKERQARAKRAEESRQSERLSPPVLTEEPVQAPIIGRKKKTKKSRLQTSTDSTFVGSVPVSPPQDNRRTQEDTKPSESPPAKNDQNPPAKAEKESKSSPSSGPLSLQDSEALLECATNIAEKFRKLQVTAATLFASLQKDGEIPPNAIDIFRNVPGINYRFDMTESDVEEVPDISAEQFQLLAEGKSVCVEIAENKWIVVLPNRQVLRGFTKAQAERYVHLREKIVKAEVARAFRSSRYDIDRWIKATVTGSAGNVGEPVEPHPAMAAQVTHLQSELGKFMADFFTSPMSTDKQIEETPDTFWDEESDHQASVAEGLSVRQPIISVEEAEQALTASRKETEALEKRLNGLLKKNRKLLINMR